MSKSINIRVSTDLHSRILELAAADNRSVASWCHLCLERGVGAIIRGNGEAPRTIGPVPVGEGLARVAPPGSLLKRR